MRKILILLLCLSTFGCATVGSNLKSVSLGMSKEEVIKVLGNPTSVSAKDNVEYLRYCQTGIAKNSVWADSSEYFVRMVDGKVESYGKMGDFDSTKNPTNDVNLNIIEGQK